jgi:hypothetical protein
VTPSASLPVYEAVKGPHSPLYRVVENSDSDDSFESQDDNIYEIECSLLLRESKKEKVAEKSSEEEKKEEFGETSG